MNSSRALLRFVRDEIAELIPESSRKKLLLQKVALLLNNARRGNRPPPPREKLRDDRSRGVIAAATYLLEIQADPSRRSRSAPLSWEEIRNSIQHRQ